MSEQHIDWKIRSDNWQKFCQLYIDENTRLKAEVERLRKAGDAMIKAFVWLPQTIAKHHQDAWNAAKEGKPIV